MFEKLYGQGNLKVVCLGGSITEGAGAVDKTNRWTTRLVKWLNSLSLSGTTFTEINSGIGGTASDYGLLRLQRDVIAHEPDIVFLEYAVNDAGDETNGVCFESLVRMAMDGPGHPAVILLFSVFMDDFNLQERMIPVGKRCQTAMISLKNAVTPQFSEESPVITKRQYFYDLFHPSNDGHRIMADCIDYFWEQAAKASKEEADAVIDSAPAIGEKYRNLRTFDRSNYASHPVVKSLSEGVFSDKDTVLQYVEKDDNPQATAEFPENWGKAANRTGEAFRMKLCCKDLLLVYKDSGDVSFGKAKVAVDGNVTRVIDPLEVGWNHCTAYVVYESDTAAEHEIEISMEEGEEEKAFTILGFGYTTE